MDRTSYILEIGTVNPNGWVSLGEVPFGILPRAGDIVQLPSEAIPKMGGSHYGTVVGLMFSVDSGGDDYMAVVLDKFF